MTGLSRQVTVSSLLLAVTVSSAVFSTWLRSSMTSVGSSGVPGAARPGPARSGGTSARVVPRPSPGSWCRPDRVLAPPPGFRPLRATDSQLLANGFPPRPPASDLAGLRYWRYAVRRAVRFVRPNPVCGGVGRGTVRSDNWAGHVVPSTAHGGAPFTAVQAEWVQPAVTGRRRNGNYDTAPTASFWTGLGVTNLIQAGADSIATARPQYRFWTEDYPRDMVWEGPPIGPGQTAFVYVAYLGGHQAYYFLENVSAGLASAFTNPAPYVGADAANFVNERPNGRSLPQFGIVPVFNARFWQGGQSFPLTGAGDRWVMTGNCRSNGVALSAPSAVTAGSFQQVWRHSQPFVNTC